MGITYLHSHMIAALAKHVVPVSQHLYHLLADPEAPSIHLGTLQSMPLDMRANAGTDAGLDISDMMKPKLGDEDFLGRQPKDHVKVTRSI